MSCNNQAVISNAVCSVSCLISLHTIKMTDSIKNQSMDFRVLLSPLPLSSSAKSIAQRDFIDSDKGVRIQQSMSVSAMWRKEEMRHNSYCGQGDCCACLIVLILCTMHRLTHVIVHYMWTRHCYTYKTSWASGCWGADIDYQALWSHWSVSTGGRKPGRSFGWG